LNFGPQLTKLDVLTLTLTFDKINYKLHRKLEYIQDIVGQHLITEPRPEGSGRFPFRTASFE
jgi:hypothetical protein